MCLGVLDQPCLERCRAGDLRGDEHAAEVGRELTLNLDADRTQSRERAPSPAELEREQLQQRNELARKSAAAPVDGGIEHEGACDTAPNEGEDRNSWGYRCTEDAKAHGHRGGRQHDMLRRLPPTGTFDLDSEMPASRRHVTDRTGSGPEAGCPAPDI